MSTNTLYEFGSLTGMHVSNSGVSGRYRGYEVVLTSWLLDKWHLAVTFLGINDQERASRFDTKRVLANCGLVGGGTVMPDHILIAMAGSLGPAKATQIKAVLDALVDAMSGTPGAGQISAGPTGLDGSESTTEVSEFADLTGLRLESAAAFATAFGQYGGYLVRLSGKDGDSFEMIVTYPKVEDHTFIDENLRIDIILEKSGLSGTGRTEPGRVTVTIESREERADAARMKEVLESVIDVMSDFTPKYGNVCMQCGSLGVERTLLMSGLPIMLCGRCLQRRTEGLPAVQAEMGVAEPRTVHRAEPDFTTALTFGFAAMIGMALLWGIISAATYMTIYYLGFVVGFAVVYATAYGSKVVTGGVITLGVALAVTSSFLGEVLFVIFMMMREGLPLSLFADAFGLYLALEPGNFALAMILGLVGAGAASYYVHSER